MKTLHELVRLEELRHETGLRGDALERAFQEDKAKETKPFYKHNEAKQLRFFTNMYNLTFENDPNAPDFNSWLNDHEYEFIYSRKRAVNPSACYIFED